MTRLPLIAALLLLASCERQEEPTIYAPGEYASKLDATGRRHIIADADGHPLGKIRVRKDALRVYDAEMARLGEVRGDGKEIEVERSGEVSKFESPSLGVTILQGRLRIEMVEHGWAIFDANAQRLGYFEWLSDGRLALRDDYGSAPRVFAHRDGADARTATGQVIVTVLPPYSAAKMLPFALEPGGLDELDRVALGVWLVAHRPQKPKL